MQQINFSIKYSSEFEVQRVLSTQKRLKWYIDNKYNVNNFILPQNIEIGKLENISESEIKTSVDQEYDPKFYEPHVLTTNSLLPGYLKNLSVFIQSLNINIIPEIEICFTRYGIAGSYNVPNVIIVNISKFFQIGLVRNILHETIHLHIQELINKYNISQWQKEAIVDCVFGKVFPELLKRQNYKEDVSEVQKIFSDNYPNLDLIMSTVQKSLNAKGN